MARSTLQRPVLVLNRQWQPVHIATVARALIQLFTGTARVVDPEDYQTYDWDDWSKLRPQHSEICIRAARHRLRVPEVVTLVRYDGLPVTTVSFNRRNLFKRDRFTCQYCGHQPGLDQLTIDHVIPRAHGGVSSWENCVLACVNCNWRKADRTPEQAGMRLRKPPTRPTWQPLYAWHSAPVQSWSRFVSQAYWNATLKA